MAFLNLDSFLSPDINYTRRDEITFSLLDVIKCLISLEITNNMIIFNHQIYDRATFERHHSNKMAQN